MGEARLLFLKLDNFLNHTRKRRNPQRKKIGYISAHHRGWSFGLRIVGIAYSDILITYLRIYCRKSDQLLISKGKGSLMAHFNISDIQDDKNRIFILWGHSHIMLWCFFPFLTPPSPLLYFVMFSQTPLYHNVTFGQPPHISFELT